MNTYIDASEQNGKEFYINFFDKGKVVMLNLLKFKTNAIYTDLDEKIEQPAISGEKAYKIYTDNTIEELNKLGSRMLYYGESKAFLIGPDLEKWDVVILMEHQSVQKFIEFSQSDAYLNNVKHRTAGLQNSRLLPTTKKTAYKANNK